jgi:hypothetical protein
MTLTSAPTPLVPLGSRSYRRAIRRTGPLRALIAPAVLGALSVLLLWGNDAGWRGVLGFVCGVLAAPLMLAFGVPMRPDHGGMAIGVAASALLWLAVGAWAAARATRRPAADWRDFWREYRWLAGGVWAGVLLAALGAAVATGAFP